MTEDQIERLIAVLNGISDALCKIAADWDEQIKLMKEMTYVVEEGEIVSEEDIGVRVLRVDRTYDL